MCRLTQDKIIKIINIFDTSFNAPSSHGVDELLLTLSEFSNFYDGKTRQD